jgi:hypothetical protein
MKAFRATIAAIAVFGFAGAAVAAEHGEFGDMCTTGLAMHKQVQSDCSHRATWDGKQYCFGDQKAELVFFQKGPDEMISKAAAYYKELHKDAKN